MVNQDRSARLRSRLSPPADITPPAEVIPPVEASPSAEITPPAEPTKETGPEVADATEDKSPTTADKKPSNSPRSRAPKRDLKVRKPVIKISYRESHKMLGVWLSNDLLDRLDRASEEIGESKASIVARAIEAELKRAKIS